MSDRAHHRHPSGASLEWLQSPQRPHTPIAEHFGVDTQLLIDALFHAPDETLPRAVLVDHLEERPDHPFTRYLRLVLQNPDCAEAAHLLHEHRHEFDALFFPSLPASQGRPSLIYDRGLPRRLLCDGDLIHEQWYATIALPLQRVIPSYGYDIAPTLLEPLKAAATHALSEHNGTGLLPVEILHYALGPVATYFSPTADLSELHHGVSTATRFFRALRSRGLVRGECSPSTLGQAMRMCPGPINTFDMHTLCNELLFMIDGCQGRGATRYAIQEGFMPLLQALNVRPRTPHLRPFTNSLLGYVNELIRIGVPIGTVMQRDITPILVSLQADPRPSYFQELLRGALRTTRR